MRIISTSKLKLDATTYPDLEQIVYYKYLLTHAEYDKDRWKNDPYY